ncbi:NAD(P)-dependent alcohol dehydrogenase [Anabaena sp. FACHB-1250]|uniref:alcohol dehydrogenase (NADP(+)) n=1 Tax=Dolichospermum planctonicum TaxID=136072 RepID=A0A480ABK2_9CYAN|nr:MULTISPECIES: NAD(P)-dependent alcohol dehydrogenase [Nostocales]MBD2141765.1 NAD(P)-dependent alcohol dehydrogenase [Anabaena sp. FACHB-1250]GCL41123.1 zinc-containing alcohol dehydrogenase [Dolichospermum planctonicum]
MVELKFQAYASLKPGEKLQPWEYEPAPLGNNDVEIAVTHNGLCHTDIHMRDNDWNVSKFPLVAGHEVVGNVTQIGAEVSGIKIGDRLGFGWISNSCRVCDACLRGEENICRQGYKGLIVGNNGGFANKLRACADFAYKIPDNLDSASAAPLLCAGITVYTPLRTYIKYPGAKVGVLGIGGLGHLAIKFAEAMGAEVTAFSTSSDKEAEAKEFGAHYFYNWKNTEIKAASGTLDLLLCTVSSEIDWNKAFGLLANNGVLCLVGLPVSTLNIPLLPLVFGQKAIAGSVVGGRRFMKEMLEFAAIHQIKPMIETIPISQINAAMDRVVANKARYRIVLV